MLEQTRVLIPPKAPNSKLSNNNHVVVPLFSVHQLPKIVWPLPVLDHKIKLGRTFSTWLMHSQSQHMCSRGRISEFMTCVLGLVIVLLT